MSFKAGIKEAANILAGLDMQQREKILELIVKKNPKMAETLRQNLVSIDDLKYATVKMLQEFLREVKLSDLAMALRIASEEVQNHILNSISKSMREEIKEVLDGPPQPVPEVRKSYQKVMEVIKRKAECGELILKDGGDILV